MTYCKSRLGLVSSHAIIVVVWMCNLLFTSRSRRSSFSSDKHTPFDSFVKVNWQKNSHKHLKRRLLIQIHQSDDFIVTININGTKWLQAAMCLLSIEKYAKTLSVFSLLCWLASWYVLHLLIWSYWSTLKAEEIVVSKATDSTPPKPIFDCSKETEEAFSKIQIRCHHLYSYKSKFF